MKPVLSQEESLSQALAGFLCLGETTALGMEPWVGAGQYLEASLVSFCEHETSWPVGLGVMGAPSF